VAAADAASDPAEDLRVGLCTAPDAETAARLGRDAVEAGLAACANVVPGLRSIYRWGGAVQDEGEALIVFKTTAGAWPALAAFVAGRHPYEVPELLALPVHASLAPYADWVRAAVAPVDSPGTGA
jgi:periplasmic divalent cation tolerance protein